MQHFFQKFQTSIENLNPFPFDLGTHLIFVFFCFLLFVVYIFASKFILRLISFRRVYDYKSNIDLVFLKTAKSKE